MPVCAIRLIAFVVLLLAGALAVGGLPGCGGTCTCEEAPAGEDEPPVSEGADDVGAEDGGFPEHAPGDAGILVINEVDYDNPGADTQEFIEIHNPGPEDIALAGLALVLINGGSGVEYDRYALDEAAAVLPAGGYLVIGSASLLATLPADTLRLALGGSLQNGAPDGLALVDTVGARVLDALSYEGTIIEAQISELSEAVTLVEGLPTPVVDDNALGSLARTPNGQDTDVARDDWQYAPVPTPGASN